MELDKKYKNSFKNTVNGGLAAFLVLGLNGCDGSNDSLATKQQKCKLQEYRIQHQEECDNINQRFGNTSVNNANSNSNSNSNSHSSGSSWVPMWMLMNNNSSANGNAHSGYTYGNSNNTNNTNTNNTSKSSSYFSTGGSYSGNSGGG